MLKRLITALTLMGPAQQALACNWVNPTDGITRYIECQSNWRGFITEPEVTKRMVEIGASYARGEAEKFAALAMIPRQLITVDAADSIHANFRKADQLIDSVNARIRRESAMQDGLDSWSDDGFRRSLPVGVFAGFSYSSKNLPLADQVLKLLNMTSGASVTFALVMMPKKIVLVQDVQTGQILNLKDKTVTRSEEDATPIPFESSSFNTRAAEQYTREGGLRRLAIDFRPMVIAAADLAPGLETGKKNDAHFNLGLVFGDQVVSTHQLLGAGISGSIPAKAANAMVNVPGIIPAPARFILRGMGAHRLGVDTVKWGTTVATPQNPFADSINTTTNIVTFKPVTYLWFRWSLTNGRGVGNSDAQATADAFNIGEYRANGFVSMGAFNDGETESQLNGVQLIGNDEKQSLIGWALSSTLAGLKTSILPGEDEPESSIEEGLKKDSSKTEPLE